jgi:PhoPQ-activated pathogenicity-related protein
MISRLFSRLFLAVIASVSLPAAIAHDSELRETNALADYIGKPDDSFGWKEVASGRLGNAEYVEYLLTSQTWRGVQWKHQLFMIRPASVRSNARHGLLFIHSGRWKPEYENERKNPDLPSQALLFLRLAEDIGAPLGVLRQVPFQPMFDLREDALIAYSFDQYLKTGESDWPLLLPMTKSTVRAMDAMQSIAQARWEASLAAFTLVGASKRGWTAWLTAANDDRVMAVVPMVIDVLNMPAQMEHQRATWGEVSDEIRDYAAVDLPSRLKTERGVTLLSMVDPFSYRQRLTQPKLILLSTNDRYWPLDALNLYWKELPEPKHVLYVPNQGHGLRDIERVIGGVSAAHRYAASGTSLPRTSWSFDVKSKELGVHVRTDRPVQRVLAWSARSPTLDFRDANWTSRQCEKSGEEYDCGTARGERGYTALFAETSFNDGGERAFSTTTTVCIAGPASSQPPEC